MESQAEAEWAAFEEKVKRTVFFDNLSPQVTESVIRTALDQFANVLNVHFIPNYSETKNVPQCALVEMEDSKQAEALVSIISNYPFMMSGMPRPVRAQPAEMNMFETKPRKPGRRIECRWLDSSDADYEVARQLKRLTKRHAAEASLLLQKQLEEEEKLAKQQEETLKINQLKFEMIEGVMADGTARRLARMYGMKVLDDY